MLKQVMPTVLISLAIVVAAWLFSDAYRNRQRSNDLIHVTGLGSRDFTADLIVWRGSFSRQRMDLKEAYAALKADQESIQKYLQGKGLAAEAIVFSSVNIQKQFSYTYDDKGNSREEFKGYSLSQTVELESKEVDKIEAIARQVTELINDGIEFSSNTPEYYYTKLAELKIEMVAAATEDGRTRAEQIAKKAKAKLGNLRYAQMGIFQIVAQNSSEDYSWGGTFNTASKHKTASITMKLQFGTK